MNKKLFQWLFNTTEPIYKQNKDYIVKIVLNIATLLFLFNIIIVLISILIVTTTENYELSFNILAGALLIFTIYVVGGYFSYVKRKMHLSNIQVDSISLIKNIVFSTLYMSLTIYLLDSFTNSLRFNTSLINELKDPMSYVIPGTIGFLYGLLTGIFTWLKQKK